MKNYVMTIENDVIVRIQIIENKTIDEIKLRINQKENSCTKYKLIENEESIKLIEYYESLFNFNDFEKQELLDALSEIRSIAEKYT